MDGGSRLRALCMAQAFFQHKGVVLIFDEAEDIFNDGSWFGEKSTAQTHKGWMNRMLKSNPVPALWITNMIGCMDPAFVRRFDIALEVPLPTKHQREHILLQECDEFLDKAALRRFDLKVKFDYLHADQAWELLLRQCKAQRLRKPAQRLRLVLDQVVGLTPGDFSAVTRQSRFQPIQSAQALVVALAKECAVKNEGIGRKIGFV